MFAKNDAYVPRKDGVPSFNAGPKIVYVDRVVWNFIPDPATASAALTQGEIDWWENPTIDLVPQTQAQQGPRPSTVKDRTGEIGCLRFNHLFPPFDNPAIRRVVVAAIDQKEIMEAVRRRRAVPDQDRCRHLRARHADGEHGRRGDHARPEGLSTS